MIPFETLESTHTPDGRRVELNRRGADYFLCVDRAPHYASDSVACQQTMAREAFQVLKVKRQPRALLEGLGLGFVLEGALDILPPRAQITVAEAVVDLPAWFASSLSTLHPTAFLDDPRVVVRAQNLLGCLDDADQPAFDAIVLDPDFSLCPSFRLAITKKPQAMVQRLKHALRIGGRCVIRLEDRSPALARAFKLEGFSLSERLVHPSGREKGRKHLILTAALPYESRHDSSGNR